MKKYVCPHCGVTVEGYLNWMGHKSDCWNKSRMFKFGDKPLKTWNPWFGCEHHCYRDGCWAKVKVAPRVGAIRKCSDCLQFLPHLHEKVLHNVPKDPRIFVVAHGDLWGSWVPEWAIEKVLEACRDNPRQMWFFETKNPQRYLKFMKSFPDNTVLSATIETNRDYPVKIIGYAPQPVQRYNNMLDVSSFKIPIHISIEPVLDFDLDVLIQWMQFLRPFRVSVGYDSLNNLLPEPGIGKVVRLIEELEKFTEVERKKL